MNKRLIDFRAVAQVLGALLVIIGLSMWLALPFSFYYKSGDHWPIFNSGLLVSCFGGLLWWFNRLNNKGVRKREGYLVVTLGWVFMCLASAIPYLMSQSIPELGNAVFEAMSGLTTTGASILTDIESMPKGILFWRSMTHWIGGMGIIVLTVALLPLLGVGGVELFVAESPGPTSDKIHPRIRETAKRLWLIYIGLTGLLMLLLWAEGMNFYDAINHAMATMATGGFSTKNASVAHFDSPAIHYTIALFMFFAGTNFTLIYFALKGRMRTVWQSDEFRAYFFVVLGLVIVFTFTVWSVTENGLEKSFRDSLFQILALITTTGFVTADYTAWTPVLTMLCFLLLFLGGCAGSTAGGIKFVRNLVYFKTCYLEFEKLLHPNAVIPLKINKSVVSSRIRMHVLVFLALYLSMAVAGAVFLSILEIDFMTSLGASVTCLSNVGPAIGKVGPVDNFAHLPMTGKWFLSFLMLLGRLELFTVLVLFSPYFWRTN
jgi:trk system potassium uptake protein TrkH